MTESGFQKAQSDNLPKIDAFMMSSYFASNNDFTSAEIRGVKAARSERESYGDAAVGYVQVKRDNDICVVKGRITPEHNVRNKCYNVTDTCNETEEIIISVQCEGCAAHLGGCKHAIAFLAWLHRRSEDPPSTSVECYWKKPKLSSVGTSLQFIKAKDMYNGPEKNVAPEQLQDGQTFLDLVISHSKAVGDMENQLTKYYREPKSVEKLSIHHLVSLQRNKPKNALEFITLCQRSMDPSDCEEAALLTVNQNDCPLWHELRYARITASKAYEAAHCKTVDGALVESIMGSRKLKDSEAMKRGRFLEEKVKKEVEKIKKIKIKNCGLMLNPCYPVMGATPDGISEDYLIEIKCPSTEKAMKQYITNDNTVSAKYMVQIQLQMYFYKKLKGLFCVASHSFETNNHVSIIEVCYDKDLCENIFEKCTSFWTNAIFPILFK